MAFDPQNIVAQLDKKADVKKLLRIVNKLDIDGRAILLSAIGTNLTQFEKTQVITKIKTTASVADAGVRDWLVQGITASYVAGMNQTVKNLKAIKFKAPIGSPKLTQITVEMLSTVPSMQPHLEAVNTLLSEAYLDFGSTMTNYTKGAERIMNDTAKRQIRASIAEGRLEGSSVRAIKKTVVKVFEKQGFTVLVDKGGRKWSLEAYTNMLTRTQLIKANNEGVINRASDFDVDIVEISSHGTICSICGKQEGKIYSISGKSKEFPPLSGNEPPYHPNCKHTLLMRPDLK